MSLPAGTTVINGFALTPDGALYVTPTGTASITGGTITGVAGVPLLLSKSSIPVVVASSGTMGNNGAVSAMTTFTLTYPSVYLVLPAGAIATGVPATTDTYYCVMSSGTAGTVFNNKLSDNLDSTGAPLIPASPVAFSTTGPGAFTGVTGATTILTITVPAGVLGTTGILSGDLDFIYNGTANNKLTAITFGGTSVYSANIASSAFARCSIRVGNEGSASVQSIATLGIATAGITGSGPQTNGAVNTANATTVTVALTHGTATDFAGIFGYTLFVTK